VHLQGGAHFRAAMRGGKKLPTTTVLVVAIPPSATENMTNESDSLTAFVSNLGPNKFPMPGLGNCVAVIGHCCVAVHGSACAAGHGTASIAGLG